jgi:hypothetical protein
VAGVAEFCNPCFATGRDRPAARETVVKSTKTPENIELLEIQQKSIQFCLVGLSPLIYNAVSEKSRRELLLPSGRKNSAARAHSLKHNPIEEYRNSVYRYDHDELAARLCFPAAAFKRALATAALDIPGATKSAVGRLSWVVGDKVPIYGVPQLHMGVVRSADMGNTPDIRTRAILPQWACTIKVNFVAPQLTDRNVTRLLGAAGILCGIGDFRQEKGAGSYGQFRIADGPEDPEFVEIVQAGSRKDQDAALLRPKSYDAETESLFSWVTEEIGRRQEDMKSDAPTAAKGRRGKGANGIELNA